MRPRLPVAVCVVALASAAAPALETDQFYAWKRTLEDSGAAINAEVNGEIDEVLARINARGGAGRSSCRKVERALRRRFTYLIFLRPELWAINTPSVDRVPATPEEELAFRHAYLYGRTSPLDAIRWMPPSPTILVGGVRIGTDKLSHFFSQGAWLHEEYRDRRRRGDSEAGAMEHAIRFGIMTERTLLGGTSSGVLSLGDLEANHQGLLFYNGLCDADAPALVRTAEGWRLTRPFDLAAHVTPEWDESWQPNLMTPKRWEKVRPVMAAYCPLLHDPEIAAQRAAYAARDRETLTETILGALVVEGKLDDPAAFTIESLCASAPP